MNFGNVLIIGDSYSAFEGYTPGFRSYYPTEESAGSGVNSVDTMWWHGLLSEDGGNLIRNDSLAGSPICYTGYNGSSAESFSFVGRVKKLIEDGFFEKNNIDTVFVFGGTNDSWAGAPLGEIKYEEIQNKDLFSIFPATCCLLSLLKGAAPGARIIFIINTVLREGIADGFTKICVHYGVCAVRLKNIDKHRGHPTDTGMKQIRQQIVEELNKA